MTTLSIDPDNCTDIDDALSVEYNEDNGTYSVYVHIADVSEMIQKDSPLDIESRRRGRTFYTPRQGAIAPMIPRYRKTLNYLTLSSSAHDGLIFLKQNVTIVHLQVVMFMIFEIFCHFTIQFARRITQQSMSK